jgi:hypothetical protein
MSKKKLAAVAVLATLVVGGGVYGGLKLLKKDWEDRKAELVEALSAKFLTSGAPNKAVADKAATCVADALVPVADAQKCSAEGEDVLKAMSACLNSSQEMQIAFLIAFPACIQESLKP